MKSFFEIYKETMLTPKAVLDKAIRKVVRDINKRSYTKKNFSKIIDEIGAEAYKVFLAEEKRAGQRAIKKYFTGLIPDSTSLESSITIVASRFKEFNSFFLSLAQSRKPRAGSTFEWIIKGLFKELGYPFAEQQVINGKPDFLMPSRKHYDKNPMDCIIFTVKTTVRERWRQIVTEGTKGLGFFLATVDRNISDNQLSEMLRNRIYLVVSESLKKKVPHYRTAVNVISFEEFFRDYLDPAVKRWKRD